MYYIRFFLVECVSRYIFLVFDFLAENKTTSNNNKNNNININAIQNNKKS